MFIAPDAGRPDTLTRTILQIDDGLPAASLEQMKSALQRVPGVLLADVDFATARTIVAHDAGVPSASLLAAALRAGVSAKLVVHPGRSTFNAQVERKTIGVPLSLLLIAATSGLLMLGLLDVCCRR